MVRTEQPHTRKSLSFSQFMAIIMLMPFTWTLDKVVLETRFTHGYLYWDKTGLAVNRLLEWRPQFEVSNATPREAIMTDPTSGVTISFSPTFASLAGQAYAQTKAEFLKEFYSLCRFFHELVFKEFEIRILSRVGNRMSFWTPAENEDAAAVLVQRISAKLKMGDDLLNPCSDGRLKSKRLREVTCRFQDEKTGLTITLKPATHKITIEGPSAPIIQEALPKPSPHLLVDIDFFTVGLLQTEMLLPEEFVAGNIKLAQTRILPLFDL